MLPVMFRLRHGLGCLPDLADGRDIPLLGAIDGVAVPSAYSLRHPAVTPRNQGGTSSCVGFAWAQGLELAWAHQGIMVGNLSPLFLYFLARSTHGAAGQDTGTHLRSVAKVVKRFGAAAEAAHPFSRWRVTRSPPWRAYTSAHDRKGLRGYYRVSGAHEVRRAIAAGFPVVGGWEIDRAFREYAGGVMGAPSGRTIGRHAMLIDAYTGGVFSLCNSWSTSWGEGGFCRVNEAFVANMEDGWAIDTRP